MTTLDFKLAVIEACKMRFAEMQGHAPSELYEDGYADACAACVAAIERIPSKYSFTAMTLGISGIAFIICGCVLLALHLVVDRPTGVYFSRTHVAAIHDQLTALGMRSDSARSLLTADK